MNEFTIEVPPLRERREDIPYLAKLFLDITNAELNKNVRGFSESAIKDLMVFDWPGNVRQLRSTIRRAVLMADDLITEKHLDIMKRLTKTISAFSLKNQGILSKNLSLKEIVRQNTIAVEREVLVQTLNHTGGNKAKAARMLQIDYKTIHTKIKRLGLEH